MRFDDIPEDNELSFPCMCGDDGSIMLDDDGDFICERCGLIFTNVEEPK